MPERGDTAQDSYSRTKAIGFAFFGKTDRKKERERKP